MDQIPSPILDLYSQKKYFLIGVFLFLTELCAEKKFLLVLELSYKPVPGPEKDCPFFRKKKIEQILNNFRELLKKNGAGATIFK